MKRLVAMLAAILLITPMLLVESSTAKESLLKPVVSITGKALDKSTDEPLELNITILSEDKEIIGKAKSNSKDGYYFITGLKPEAKYFIRFEKEDYQAQEFEFKFPKVESYKEISQDIKLKPKSLTNAKK